jgi:hypothetical protein
VAGAVHVPGLVGFALDGAVDAAAEQLEIDQPLRQDAQRRLVIVGERGARVYRGNGRLLRRQDDLVDLALLGVEASVDRKGARDVGGVAGDLAAGVDQDQRSSRQQLVVFDVVQDAGVGTTGDDGRVGVAVGAAAAELVASSASSSYSAMPGWQARMARLWPAEAMSAARRMSSISCASLVSRISSSRPRRSRISPGARVPLRPCGTNGVQRVGDAPVPCGVVTQRVPQAAVIGDQLRQLLFELPIGCASLKPKASAAASGP